MKTIVIVMATLGLMACGGGPEDTTEQDCVDKGSTLAADGTCIWPIFTRVPSGPAALSERCPFDQTAQWPDCIVCHRIGSPIGGAVSVHPITMPRPALSGGCLKCHY